MENKRKRITGSEIDKVIAKAGSPNPQKSKTGELLPEKEQANADLHDQAEQATKYINKPHMLFK